VLASGRRREACRAAASDRADSDRADSLLGCRWIR
jgi:hypothetical protein